MSEKNGQPGLETILGVLLLHEALIANLYADHIQHDKELRDMNLTPQQSLQAFRNFTNRYVESYPLNLDAEEIKQAAKDRVQEFFQDVEDILISRQVLDERDPSL